MRKFIPIQFAQRIKRDSPDLVKAEVEVVTDGNDIVIAVFDHEGDCRAYHDTELPAKTDPTEALTLARWLAYALSKEGVNVTNTPSVVNASVAVAA